MIVFDPKVATCVLQARSILPFITIAQEPHTADLHDDLNERVPSISSLIRRRTARIVKPGITFIRYDSK